jgi:hypothetical protein
LLYRSLSSGSSPEERYGGRAVIRHARELP